MNIVYRPCEVYVDDPPLGRASLGLTDGDGVLHILKLRDPLMLPERALRAAHWAETR